MNPSEKRFEKIDYYGEYEQIATKEYVTVADGSELLVYSTKSPEENRSPYTLFLVPGWSSIILAWDHLLMAAKDTFDIYYYESREKKSSKINWDTKVHLDTLSDDLATIIEYYDLQEDKLIILSSSYGSIVLAYALAKNKIEPLMPILFGPLTRLETPKGAKILIKYSPAWFIRLFKKPVQWWLINKKSESKEQAAKLLRALEEIDLKKNLHVLRHIIMDDFFMVYTNIDNKVLIIDAESDKLHQPKNIKRIENSMKNTLYANIRTNKNAHSKPMLDLILEYIPRFKEDEKELAVHHNSGN